MLDSGFKRVFEEEGRLKEDIKRGIAFGLAEKIAKGKNRALDN